MWGWRHINVPFISVTFGSTNRCAGGTTCLEVNDNEKADACGMHRGNTAHASANFTITRVSGRVIVTLERSKKRLSMVLAVEHEVA